MQLVVVNMAQRGFWRWTREIRLAVSPDRFLAYIRDANFVLTDSFHGTAFSLIYKRRFLSFVTSTVSGRIYSLLSAIGLGDRMVPGVNLDEEKFKLLMQPPSDSAYCNLIDQKEDSIAWLRGAIDAASK